MFNNNIYMYVNEPFLIDILQIIHNPSFHSCS